MDQICVPARGASRSTEVGRVFGRLKGGPNNGDAGYARDLRNLGLDKVLAMLILHRISDIHGPRPHQSALPAPSAAGERYPGPGERQRSALQSTSPAHPSVGR